MTQLSSIQHVLTSAKERKNIPVLRVIRTDPDIAAVGAKLTEDPRSPKRYDREDNLTIETPSLAGLREKAERVMSRQQEAKNLMSVLSDLELIKQILVSSILAPKDWVTTDLSYDFDETILSPDLRAQVLDRIRKYFETSYKIKDYLYRIIEDVFFNTGSYPVVVLPENAIDELINGSANFSMEALRERVGKEFMVNGRMRPLGLLGSANSKKNQPDPTTTSFESILTYRQINHRRDYDDRVLLEDGKEVVDLKLRVTDNYNVLKRPAIESAMVGQIQTEIIHAEREPAPASYETELGVGFESASEERARFNLSDREIVDLLYKSRNQSGDTIRVIKTQDQLNRHSVTDALIQHFPSESLIPVYVPGNEENHVGYFALIDENGNPITMDSYKGGLGGLLQNNQNSPFSKALNQRASAGMVGSKSSLACGSPLHVNEMIKTYMDIVEADLMARLRNGIYSSSYKLASNQEIYRIMLARALAGNTTQVLWIPKELITYFAVEYDSDGIGISLTHKNSVLGAMRAGLLFADVRSAIRNSVGRTIVDINLEENDPDPDKRIEQAIHQFMTTRQESVPWGVMSPVDTADFIGRAGVEFKFSGHPRIPDMTIDTSETNSNFVRPEADMQEYLAKQFAMGFGIPHDVLDNIHQPEHATTVVSQNILLTKRVIQHQDKLNPQISDHIRKVSRHSTSLRAELVELLLENFEGITLTDKLREMATKDKVVRDRIAEITVRDIINSLEVELPKPDTTLVENQMRELEQYESILDKKLDAYFDGDVFSEDIMGELGVQVDAIRAVVRSHYMRQEMARLGMSAEIAELFNHSEEGLRADQLYQEQSSVVKSILTSFARYAASMKDFKVESDKVSQTLGLDDGGGGDYDSDDSSDSSEDSGDDDMPDFGEDFDLDEDDADEGGDEFEDDEPDEDLGDDEPLEV